MNYEVGTRIDLTYLNDSPAPRVEAREDYPQYDIGTKLSFLKMACGMIVTYVNEPPLALSIKLV